MSDDLIRRSDAIKAVEERSFAVRDSYTVKAILRNVPSADRPQAVIAQVTFDDEKLREIVKEAVERFKEEYDVADRPQGKWIKRFGLINCSVCKHSSWSDSFEDLVRSFNYCPNCGARMKGADDADG